MNPDNAITLALNHFAGRSHLLDATINLLAGNYAMNGVPLVALLWLAWYKSDNFIRARIIAGTIAVGLAGLIARISQHVLPQFHLRPLHTAGLNLTIPYGVDPTALNHWNSMPSDTCAWFCAIATAVWCANRRLGLIAFGIAVVASFSRVYLLYHWTSDVIAGAFLGVTVSLLVQRCASGLCARLLTFERTHPGGFYSAAFVLSYQVADIFSGLFQTILTFKS